MKSKLIIFFLTISIGMSKSNDGPSLTTTKWISEGSPKKRSLVSRLVGLYEIVCNNIFGH